MKYLWPFFNPVAWFKAARFARKNAKFDKASYDMELFLYSKMLTNNMLHYGYFEDPDTRPESISFEQFEAAQMLYSEQLIQHITNKTEAVLDIGCGMGGFSNALHQRGFKVESLTPNKNQIAFIKEFYPELTPHHCGYEQFENDKKFGTVVNSESLQYIRLDEAFSKTNSLILPGGKWIIIDYFSLIEKGPDQKPHNLNHFYKKAEAYGWEVTYKRDVTPNILPTLAYINMYVNRFVLPLKHFSYEKLRFKKPKMFYLTRKLRESLDQKLQKESKTVDPEVFIKERRYMLIVLEKKG